jgi:tetratricopeptide (TPR) repeat protein
MDPIGTAGLGGAPASRPLRVFLSHTHDLRRSPPDRSFIAAAEAAVNRAGHAASDMAYFTARPGKPAAYCIDMVGRADIYVGILGLRYGTTVPDRSDLSYTELEFETALEKGLPRLIILIREDSPHLLPDDQSDEHRAKQEAFRARVRETGVTVARAIDPNQLELKLYQALVELGSTPNAPGRLAEAQALLASMPTDVLPDRAPELPPGSRMPLKPNPLFVGRGDELLQVANALRGGDTTVARGQVVASTGLGGLGKTQLAVELVHRYGPFFAGGVFWLSFASGDEIPLQVAGCAGPGLEARSLEERVQRVMDAWQSATPRLLVFDNCEEESLLEAWRPTSGGCRVLVTSRRSEWTPTLGVTSLPLDVLPRPDSIALLRRYRPDLALDDPGLDAIAAELGDLPLALHLAGSYLRVYRAEVSLDGYLAELRRSEAVQHASLLGTGLEDSISPTHHVQGVAQTFALCLGRLDRTREVDRVATGLLARMACMAPGEPVPRDLLAKTMEDADPLTRADGLRRLGAIGLVEEGDGWLRLHRLVAWFVRQEGLDPRAEAVVAQALIGCGEDAERGHLTGSALTAVIPHLADMVGAAREGIGDERRTARLCNAAGWAMLQASDFKAARLGFERALAIWERDRGPDHPDTAVGLNNLAYLLHNQGELTAAERLYRRALAIWEQALGPEHPDAAQGLSSLGVLLWSRGDLGAARPILERVLAFWQGLAPDHRHTALSLHNLGTLLRDQGELATARPLYERALAIREQVLGIDHPDTAMSLNNLAELLRAQGDLVIARVLHERALDVRELVLGTDHPDTAFSLHNLAAVLRDLGELDAARPICERALAIWERVLGPDHPYTSLGLNGLARLLHAQDDLDTAKPLFERALAIRVRVLGPDHPRTAQSLHDFALLLRDQGDPAAARPLFERALAIREGVLGPDHPDTVATRRAVAELTADDDGPEVGR